MGVRAARSASTRSTYIVGSREVAGCQSSTFIRNRTRRPHQVTYQMSAKNTQPSAKANENLIAYRSQALKQLPTCTGVYVLCDLDEVPIYVGQSVDSIRGRVRRHLTSARSDIIANRQIDVWEVGFVWAFAAEGAEIAALESHLFHKYDPASPLLNGTTPPKSTPADPDRNLTARVVVLPEHEIAGRTHPERRLPRQAVHYAQVVSHFLEVKNSTQVARALDAHFKRLKKYHSQLLNLADSRLDEPTE
jgi:hypothetical protein